MTLGDRVIELPREIWCSRDDALLGVASRGPQAAAHTNQVLCLLVLEKCRWDVSSRLLAIPRRSVESALKRTLPRLGLYLVRLPFLVCGSLSCRRDTSFRRACPFSPSLSLSLSLSLPLSLSPSSFPLPFFPFEGLLDPFSRSTSLIWVCDPLHPKGP